MIFLRAIAVFAVAVLAVLSAQAQVSGPYVTGMGVVHQVRDADTDTNGAAGSFTSSVGYGVGVAAGYQFENGIRLEGETTYRFNDTDEVNGASQSDGIHVFSGMINALWEYDNPSGVYPYFGGGLGVAYIDAEDVLIGAGAVTADDDVSFAAQGIAGLGFALTPNLTGVVEYRYFHAFDPTFSTNAGDVEAEYRSHSATFGLRYRFGTVPRRIASNERRTRPVRVVRQPAVSAAPAKQVVQPATIVTPVAVAPRPVAQAKAAGSLRRTYVVFFATDSAVLNRDARAIVLEATERAKQDQTKVIDLTGHADTTGSKTHNQRLSVRRAESAAAMLRSGGVAARLRIFGKGETDLLVPTADNVNEPRNRRVEIVLRGVDDGLVVSQN